MSVKPAKIISSQEQLKQHTEAVHAEGRLTMDKVVLDQIIEKVQEAFNLFLENSDNIQLTPAMRRSLNGVGARRWGFIQETQRASTTNPEFAPGELNTTEFRDLTYQIDRIRVLQALLLQFTFLVGDFAGILVNAAWNMALIFYRTVQGLAQLHNRIAEAVYNFLRRFFVHRRPNEGEVEVGGGGGGADVGIIGPELPGVERPQPTQKQLKHDINALMHGTKEGKVIIENYNPHLVGGEHVMLDDAHKPTIEYIEAYHNPICPNCHAENHATNDFCSKCGTKLLIEEEEIKK
jgi:ribosomal protein L40E